MPEHYFRVTSRQGHTVRSTDDQTENTAGSTTTHNTTHSTTENGTDAGPIWTTTRVPPTDEGTADATSGSGRTTRRLY